MRPTLIAGSAALLLAFCGAAAAQKLLERGKYGDPDALATVLFAFASSDLDDAARGVLDALAAQHGDATLEVVGHTDFTGDPAYNHWLADLRARAVREYLVSRGLAGDRLTVVSAGEEQPIDSNHSKVGRARNRRVDVRPAR